MSEKIIPVRVESGLAEGQALLGADKIAANRAAFAPAQTLRKPAWIRVRLPQGNAVQRLKSRLRESALVTVCDLIGRTIIMPFEVPVSLILGVVGAVVFIFLLLRQRKHG